MFNGEVVDVLLKDSRLKANQLILAFASGSTQHGAKIEGKSDFDAAGVFIGDPAMELAIGNEDPRKNGHITGSTSNDHEKNKAGDEDRKAYTLRRWAGLALKGNPAILSYLFSPKEIKDSYVTQPSVWDLFILPNKNLFLASGHASAFIGLGEAQYKRMLGLKGAGKHGQRDDLIAAHGYDVKSGMHMIRSMTEALELLKTGHMTFPRPEVDMLLSIRRGEWGMESIKNEFLRLKDEVAAAELTSPLPPVCDREAINKVIADAIIYHWRTLGYLC